jgi:hypothetical protein
MPDPGDILRDLIAGAERTEHKARRRLAALAKHLGPLREGLAKQLPRCGTAPGQHENCQEFGIWEWYDNDGDQRKCEAHKDYHFYINGPILDEERQAAVAALRALDAALGEGLKA